MECHKGFLISAQLNTKILNLKFSDSSLFFMEIPNTMASWVAFFSSQEILSLW